MIGENNDDYLGSSVAIDGSYAIVGAPNYNESMGKVYIFKKINYTSWNLDLSHLGQQQGNYFGYSVDIDSSYVIIGAPNTVNNKGKVYICRIVINESFKSNK